MDALRDWVTARWQDTLIPLAIFLASLVVLLWVRRFLARGFMRWAARVLRDGEDRAVAALRGPSFLWVMIMSAALGLQASRVSADWKEPLTKGLWTVFILSATYLLVRTGFALLPAAEKRLPIPGYVSRTAGTAVGATAISVSLLMVMQLWGAPVAPLLLVLALVAAAVGLAFRDALPSFVAYLQIQSTRQIQPGDYIKVETGEEGSVAEINWRATQLKAADGTTVLVPNRKLVGTSVVNYGRPLKRAKEPFRFYSRTHLKELMGQRARNLRELADLLRQAPESVVYYHTHHFLEEHHYLTPEPPNDFASWVADALGDEALGERLAAVDTFQFQTLGALRERLVGIIEEHMARAGNGREALAGQEFHFLKAVAFIAPTPYVAHDLRELVEILRRLPLGALYFHVFESRLRLGRTSNDFSLWLAESLGEEELADEMARLDPYNYTLEELRSLLIQQIEERIK